MGRVALVTGANQGLGLALVRGLAEHFDEDGDRVYLTGRDADRVERAAAELRDAGLSVIPELMDVSDADSVARLSELAGPADVVISNAAAHDADVKALVYINGSVPDEGEAVGPLAGPDSALSVADPTTIFTFVPGTLPPTPGSDVYLRKSTFLASFATGLTPRAATTLWATQKPITLGALNEPATAAAWRTHPSWYLVGTKDLVIPPSAQHQLARRAGSTVAHVNAGHLGLITKPAPVVRIIERADRATR